MSDTGGATWDIDDVTFYTCAKPPLITLIEPLTNVRLPSADVMFRWSTFGRTLSSQVFAGTNTDPDLYFASGLLPFDQNSVMLTGLPRGFGGVMVTFRLEVADGEFVDAEFSYTEADGGECPQSQEGLTLSLPSGVWFLAALPCQPPNSMGSLRDILADDIPGDLNTTWEVFTYDTTAAVPDYVPATLRTRLQLGQGFWIQQVTGSTVTLDICLPVPDKLRPVDPTPLVYLKTAVFKYHSVVQPMTRFYGT